MNTEDQNYKRMQIKVLYSFNNNTTVFLSRSKNQYSVKTVQIPMVSSGSEQQDPELITLGAFDLKSCIQQITKSSPENFKLQSEDYAVYYKDVTEQPDEPFVANGIMSGFLNNSKSDLIPGRVCQNLSASFLFGDKANVSPLTLEIRLKLHTIELQPQQTIQKSSQQQSQQIDHQSLQPNSQSQSHSHSNSNSMKKRPYEQSSMQYPQKRPTPIVQSSMNSAIKATRTKSLPIFNNVPNQTMFNIMNADKMNNASRYDTKSVQDRFKSAPFLSEKIIDKPVRKHRKHIIDHQQYQYQSQSQSQSQPQRAMRTRSMVNQTPLTISSPITEEPMSDATDDTEYREPNELREEDEDVDDDGDFDELSPYTPQQPPYKPPHEVNSKSNSDDQSREPFQSLPDLEDLDSKRTHTIPHSKLPKNHGLICVNSNCATTSSIAWRYFETEFRPNYFAIHRAKEFDKKNYEGMFGPLCNACYLFLRNKGFMRPENVVKKYLQQQRYKRELKNREEINELISNSGIETNNSTTINKERSNSLSAIAMRKSSQFASSPIVQHSNKFVTPSHTPSAINQVIQNNEQISRGNNRSNSQNESSNLSGSSNSRSIQNYGDLNDLMNQINAFGGPLTDIDPLPQDQGYTPPMMATKSNTRVINVYDDGEDKENCPPSHDQQTKDAINSFDSMIVKSFTQVSPQKGGQSEWMNSFFAEPTPKDQVTPADSKTPTDGLKSDPKSSLPNMKTFTHKKSSPPLNNKKAMVVNMPSSPLLTNHNSDELDLLLSDAVGKSVQYDELDDEIQQLVSKNSKLFEDRSSPKEASRVNTTNSIMSWSNNDDTNQSRPNRDINLDTGSTPNTDFFSNDDIHDKYKNEAEFNKLMNNDQSNV
ncbi:uncharacterized protein RJT21DRAFT_120346 [Scheffersomyces amazonensis]|uniref:uncharacterized protein n=1 Tax=Scheffersomyces amazonensis TaxID=1078765 RepID=UPI00315D3B1B